MKLLTKLCLPVAMSSHLSAHWFWTCLLCSMAHAPQCSAVPGIQAVRPALRQIEGVYSFEVTVIGSLYDLVVFCWIASSLSLIQCSGRKLSLTLGFRPCTSFSVSVISISSICLSFCLSVSPSVFLQTDLLTHLLIMHSTE